MVYIVINGEQFDFVSTVAPFNFTYDVTNSRIYDNDGILFLYNFFIPEKFINSTINSKEKIYEIRLFNKEKNISFDFLEDIIDFNIDLKRKNENLITISFRKKDIFKSYERFLNFMMETFNPPGQTYDCFVTSNLCNLSCPYCFQGLIHNDDSYKMKIPYEFYHEPIKKIVDINTKLLPKEKINATRIMGGEPFIVFDSFKYVFEEMCKIIKKNDDLWIYTNYTINIDKFLDYIPEMLKHVNNITIAITSDSFDYKKSLRITNKETMDKYINNIKQTVLRYKDNNKVTIASNLMFLNKKDTLETAEQLHEIGVEYLQLAYDEFTKADEAEEVQEELTNIFNTLENEGMPRLKMNLGKSVWVHFCVLDDQIEVYRSKPAFHADYVISKLNDY